MSKRTLRQIIVASLAISATLVFGSFAKAQEEPTAGFRARIEADWAKQEGTRDRTVGTKDALDDLIARSGDLLACLEENEYVDADKLDAFRDAIAAAKQFANEKAASADEEAIASAYRALRWASRDAIFANELLKDTPIVFEKANRFGFQILQEYLSYYERYSNQRGGGLFRLEKPGFSFKTTELSADFPRGLFATPSLSYDAKTLYFAFADFSKVQDPDPDAPVRNAYHMRAEGDATEQVAQFLTESDGKYCLYRMNLETGESEKLTDGPWDDFDPTLLPDGSLAFMSTRRGGFARCNQTWEPIMVATLHKRTPDGQIRHLSWHETNEWTPSVLDDGRILYTRWDYVDRNAARFQGLWLTNPDGTGAVTLFGNYTESPVACIQGRPIPNSNKIVFIATAHHTAVGGSIVILDPTKVKYDPETGQDSPESIERITPEIAFPETPNDDGEMNLPDQYYYSPNPLSEDFFLVSYSFDPANGYLTTNGNLTEDTVGSGKLGLYYRDRFGNLELLFDDEKYSCRYPLILRERETIPAKIPSLLPDESASNVERAADGKTETGTFTLFDVRESLWPFPEDRKIKELRVYQLLPKFPSHAGHLPPVGHDYAGNARMYLGSVPVEDDGSAYFTAPARKPLYFQAVDESGRAVQTMLSEVYLQPGENRGCVGCHEQQQTTFPNSENRVKAALRAPSELAPGPEGSAPFSFPILMQPLLDKRCVECHSGEEGSARPALTGDVEDHFTVSYNRLKPYLQWYAWFDTYHEVVSLPGECGADICPLSGIIDDDNHKDIGLTDEERRLIYFWLDSNIPFYGVYREDEQERQQRGEKVPEPALQ